MINAEDNIPQITLNELRREKKEKGYIFLLFLQFTPLL